MTEKEKMIKLRNLKSKDAKNMLEWMHDADTTRHFRKNMLEMTMEEVLFFIEKNKSFSPEQTSRHYAIVDEEDTYLGTISLKEINTTDKNAEYAIALRSAARGKGVAEKATSLLMEVAFEELGLERVYLNVLASNARAIGFYEKFGFREEGTFKKHLLICGMYEDLKWYGLLKDDYRIQEGLR